MADHGGNDGENDNMGFDYQISTLLYCILQVYKMEDLDDYKIGSAIAEYDKLDDVAFEVSFKDGQKVVYALQVKSVRNKTAKMIDTHYLWNNPKTNMLKYFNSYLKIKNNHQIGQMILWTNMKLADSVRDTLFERYIPGPQDIDLLGEGNSDVYYQRYKFKKENWNDLKQEFHPRIVLIKKFIDSMLRRIVWKDTVGNKVSEYYHSVMAKEIIEWNGNRPQFKQMFIEGNCVLDESKQFRECFERVMKERFKAKEYEEFSMSKLNSATYRNYFQLKVDFSFKKRQCTQENWKKWTDDPKNEKVEEFLKKFVFYTDLSDLNQIKAVIGKKLQGKNLGSYDQWYTLMKDYAFKVMVNQNQINKLFKLLQLREGMDCGPYRDLHFTNLNDLKVVSAFFNGKHKSFLCIKATQNLAGTLFRLIYVLEKKLDPTSKRYLVLNYETYDKKQTMFEAIQKDPKLEYIVIICKICLSSKEMEEINNKLSALKIIFVGTEFAMGLKTIDDRFDMGPTNNNLQLQLTKMKLSVSAFFKGKHEGSLCIKFSQNMAGTLSRLINVVEEELELNGKQYAVLNYETFNQNCSNLEKYPDYSKLSEIGLECIIVTRTTCMPLNIINEISCKFSPLKVIFVGHQFDGGLPYIVDEFDEELFNENIKPQNEFSKMKFLVGTFSHGKKKTFLCIKATQNVDCTLSRLVCAVKEELEPFSRRYLVLNYGTYHHKLTDLEAILKDTKLIEIGLECIIMTCVPSHKMKEISEKFSAISMIIVGKEFDKDLTTIDDVFDVASITNEKKIDIENTKIKLSANQSATAKNVFGNDLFTQDCYRIVLELYKTEQNKAIEVSADELNKDLHYRRRVTKKINGEPIQWDLLNQTINTLSVSAEGEKIYRYIICDEPGMGKSTELNRIAVGLRETYQDHLIVVLDCKNVASKWKGNMIDIVCDSLTSKNEFTYACVEKIVQKGKIVFLMDSYDEVISENHTILDNFLTEISSNNIYKSIILLIATRPHLSVQLKKTILDGIVCELEPFSKTDQEEYLNSFFKVEQNENDEEKTIIKNNTRSIINAFSTILKKKKSIIEIPLQTHIIAYIYKNDVKDKDFQVPKSHEIGSIYKKFVDLKFEEYIKHYCEMTSEADRRRTAKERIDFLKGHIEIAEAIHYEASQEILKEKCLEYEHYGLVRISPTAEFTHQTYFEFFITLYILKYQTGKSKEFVTFMKQNFCESRTSLVTKFLDFHIGTIDPKVNLKPASLDNRIDFIRQDNFTPPSNPRLHPGKISEFNLFLSEDFTEEKCFTLIRNCFNISVFNVLEVLYDSLPRETVSKLRFCFGKRSESNYVNLKLLGGNQLLQLLKLLLLKHPSDFVQLYLTKFKDNEEDFIEVTCRKPFIPVLEWLKIKLVPALSTEEHNALEEYVKRRFTKYFALVIQHNNAEVLALAISWIKNKDSNDATMRFLQHGNVMLNFLKNIEVPASTKDLKEKQRVIMVHLMLDLCKSNPKLFNKECIDAINNIQNNDIKKAFEDRSSDIDEIRSMTSSEAGVTKRSAEQNVCENEHGIKKQKYN